MTTLVTQYINKPSSCLIFITGFITGVLLLLNIPRQYIQIPTDEHSFKLLPQYTDRNQLINLITAEGFTTGAEVGVQLGFYAEFLLSKWPNCIEYHAIDLWAHQKDYKDVANVGDAEQESRYTQTRNRLKRFDHIIRYHRNYSNLAVNDIKDESLDFIYIDARHDYAGVSEDLTLYWPKLKRGGVFAGHDYLDVAEVKALSPHQDWSIDHQGIKRTDGKAVKSAVYEFAIKQRRQLLITLPETWPTWYMRK
jgi:hypothetical protein